MCLSGVHREYGRPTRGTVDTVAKLTVDDLRGTPDQAAASVVWQDGRASGAPSPTWRFSDRAREGGAQGLLYASRSRPDLSHLVLFEVSPATVRQAGPARPWHPPYPIPSA